ncbi:hypothetical protein HK104_008716 [Borealophlyctis nickersoniae]|nr:hypothetical protein HK104_008716 [Borealophlyctis nickersoniae]
MMPVLGLPIFWIAFPRPIRSWPGLECHYLSHPDSRLYSTMAPSLLASLSKSLALGRLPRLRPGSIFLARLESRLLLIRGVEMYFEGCGVIITGMELEPTSCHALEGAEVDSVLEAALGRDKEWTWLNHKWLHTLQPTGVIHAQAYTDARNVMTGILDNPENIRLIPPVFMKILVWAVSTQIGADEIERHASTTPINRDLLQSCWRRFPVRWYEYLRGAPNLGTMGVTGVNDQAMMIVVVACYIIVMGIGTPNSEAHPGDLPNIFRSFRGELPSLPPEGRAWLLSSPRQSLRTACLLSYRYAVKLVYEQAVGGEIEGFPELEVDVPFTSIEELLTSYRDEWHICVDPSQPRLPFDHFSTPAAWQAALDRRAPNFFALSEKTDAATGQSTVSVRLLRMKNDCEVWLGRINGEAVRGIWANVVMELLYLTNDDDERYSIQAHQILLRNLIVQSSDPPLGYPLYVAPARVSHAMIEYSTPSVRPKGAADARSKRLFRPFHRIQSRRQVDLEPDEEM